jgi:hypothetical protein
MGTISDKGISEVEEFLKSKFDKNAPTSGVPSIASPATASTRIDQLVLPDEDRGRMPFTKDKYVVRENPQLVQWERETRKFLRNLSPAHGHRISAVMVYEWATGILVKELLEQGGTASPDLRKINQCLRHYFGKPYQTYIGGRKVPRAYKVKSGYYIRRHRPMTITLYLEYSEGVLNP